MFARLVGESFARNPRRKILTAAALVVGMAVATATLSVALDVGDRLAREFRSFGANLVVTPQSDTLPVEIGGVDYRPVDEGAYLREADLGKLKTIFWRHNIIGFTPFLDVPATVFLSGPGGESRLSPITLVGTWYSHGVPVPDGSVFTTGIAVTHPWWKIDGRWFNDSPDVAGIHWPTRFDANDPSDRVPQPAGLECVVGAAFVREHFAGGAIGHDLLVGLPGEASRSARSLALRITGVVSTGGAEDNAVLVPLSIAQSLSNHAGRFRQLFVSALTKPADAFSERNPQSMTPVEYDRWFCSPYISSISYQIRQVLPGTEVRTIRRVADTEGRILSRIRLLLWLVTLAALAAAALAVAATSAATVLERRDEIGIMKAIGATNSLVAGIFLAEQLLLAVTGGAVGFLLGAALARILGSSVF